MTDRISDERLRELIAFAEENPGRVDWDTTTALRELLAAREQQPVAIVDRGPYTSSGWGYTERIVPIGTMPPVGTKLYAAPVVAQDDRRDAELAHARAIVEREGNRNDALNEARRDAERYRAALERISQALHTAECETFSETRGETYRQAFADIGIIRAAIDAAMSEQTKDAERSR